MYGYSVDVYDFCQLCTDDSVEIHIFDMNPNVEDDVFFGTMRDAQFSDYSGYTVWSFDLAEGDMVLNIDTADAE